MPGKKILLVEDEQDIAKVFTFRVRKAGYEVIHMSDGEKGLEMARTEMPDLIFLDLGLPVIPGWEVCRILKADENLKKIPVVILTASTDAIVEKTEEIGADYYMAKPYEPEEVFEVIKKFLG